MEQLPPELLSRIFVALKRHGHRYALPALSACKTGNKIGTLAVYRSLLLHKYDIVPFVRRIRVAYVLIEHLTSREETFLDGPNDGHGPCTCVIRQHDQTGDTVDRCDHGIHLSKWLMREIDCDGWSSVMESGVSYLEGEFTFSSQSPGTCLLGSQ